MRIEDLIEEIEQSIQEAKDTQTDLRHALIIVKSLIKQSIQGSDISKDGIPKIEEALSYLELMPLAGREPSFKLFQGPLTENLGDEFKKNNFKKIGNNESYAAVKFKYHIPATLNDAEFTRLKIIYAQLRLHYILHDSMSYEKKWDSDLLNHAIENEAVSSVLKQWREKMIETPQDEEEAIRACPDFRRNMTIDGKKGSEDETPEDIKKRIIRFLNKSPYKKSDPDMALLTSWLMSNGGQQINSFVQFFLENRIFNGDKLHSSGAKVTKSDWAIKDGHIFLNLKLDINQIKFIMDINYPQEITNKDGEKEIKSEMMPFQKWILITDKQNKKTSMTYFPDLENPEYEKILTQYPDKNKIPPLLTFDTQIEIKVVNGKVVADFTKLNAISFTTQLMPPERKPLAPTPDDTSKPSTSLGR